MEKFLKYSFKHTQLFLSYFINIIFLKNYINKLKEHKPGPTLSKLLTKAELVKSAIK